MLILVNMKNFELNDSFNYFLVFIFFTTRERTWFRFLSFFFHHRFFLLKFSKSVVIIFLTCKYLILNLLRFMFIWEYSAI